jgi:hypothetical protein
MMGDERDESELLTADWLRQFARPQSLTGGFLFVRSEEWRPVIGEQWVVVSVGNSGVVSLEVIREDRGRREERCRFIFPDRFTRRRFRELCAGLGIELRAG